jgi:hypothetical protein
MAEAFCLSVKLDYSSKQYLMQFIVHNLKMLCGVKVIECVIFDCGGNLDKDCPY